MTDAAGPVSADDDGGGDAGQEDCVGSEDDGEEDGSGDAADAGSAADVDVVFSDEDCPFLVRVSIPNLNIRKGAGTDYERTGKYTGVGVFTITQVKEGAGSDSGWGKLKSGAGWICLDYVKKI